MNKYTSSKLIQKYYHSQMGFKLAGIISQVDTASQVISRLLKADFIGVYYTKEGNNHLIPVSYQYGHHVSIKNLNLLEKHWEDADPESVFALPEMTDLNPKKNKDSAKDDFGLSNSFAASYQYPYYLDGSLRLLFVSYWFEKPKKIDLDTNSLLDLVCKMVSSALCVADQLMIVENYSSRLSSLLPIFEVPLGAMSINQLISQVIKQVSEVIPGKAVYLFSRRKINDELTLNEFYNTDKPSEEFTSYLKTYITPLFETGLSDDTTRYRCRPISSLENSLFNEAVALEISPDETLQMMLVICIKKDDTLAPNDRELLSVFSIFSQTVLRNALLYKRLKKANLLLEESSERLANIETIAALADMTSGLAHDFNNIFGGIVGRLQLIKLKCEENNFTSELDKIEKLVLEGAFTVKRIQEFSSSTKHRDLKTIDLCEVVSDYLVDNNSKWHFAATEKNIKIVTNFELNEAIIKGNNDDLITVIEELLKNGVEHSPIDNKIEISISEKDNKILLSVKDNGPGIPKDLHTKVFYPFYSTKTERGAGLGLSVVQGIVSRLHGKVELESSPESGTKFILKFNCSDSYIDTSKIMTQQIEKLTKNILVVDDDEDVREVLKDTLQLVGHKIVDCPDAYTALKEIEKNSFDLIITDLGMPGMTGLEMSEQIHKKHPEIPIVMITGWGTQLSTDDTARNGIVTVMSKPFHLKDVREMVDEVSCK